ncbi:S9 family peptidase [Pseudoalteromonas sp. G4]|uniref:S9 family peptidase n=1 Tax=Pseudoalteromonas sp. G4 TaxID=2992761 RepID=UPI00237D6433|nr:prolyl oligopeptidase family serine peptidase [Pseudoalteromonas sp. G4]MDE3272472.1 prolyl oligopeptidase family serine peptidase [Pseudoalteromonas sp. G4]
MKKSLLAVMLGAYFISPIANAEAIDTSKINYLGPIAPQNALKPFETNHKNAILNNLKQSLAADQASVSLFGNTVKWQSLNKLNALTEPGLQALKFTLSTTRFTPATLKLDGVKEASFYLNGELLSKKGDAYKLPLSTGQHQVIIITESVEDWGKVALDLNSDLEGANISVSSDAPNTLNAKQLFDSKTVSNLSISPNGKHLIWQTRSYNDKNGNKALKETYIKSVKSNEIVFALPEGASNFAWSSDNKHLVYTSNKVLYKLNLKTLTTSALSEELSGISNVDFYDNDTLIFTWVKRPEKSTSLTKYYQGLEDRWSYARNKTSVYLYDVNSGLMRQVSPAEFSVSLEDFDAKRGTLLLSRSISDYAAPPHMLTELLEYNLKNNSQTTVGKYRTFNSAQYSSDGLYITAGPEFGDNAGKNVASSQLSNNYDSQLYSVSYDGKTITALSKTFKPSIGQFTVLNNDDVILNVGEEDKRQLYLFDESKNRCFSVSDDKSPTLVYAGTGAQLPQQVQLKSKPNSDKTRTLWNAKEAYYAKTQLPSLEEFNFVNDQGTEIKGRVYLPSNLDKQKQYPALVYYYGGTSPVNRAFTGRYPFNLWAENGYVVYVLQPTGATGFGQNFSAKHVNAWGEYTANDIIKGTQAFLDKYTFVDKNKVGNLGASYGGFMTMLLATKTDMFSASISHAGISNITSYWGQGWWGYLYSGEASKNSFPWNNAKLYSEHSPVFNADKVKTPLLLIHGDADTNVPVGESHTMYTALKLLGQDVELVEYKGADHQIFARDKRFHWWNTMLAYFDKHLKEQPQWWQDLYPQK